MKAKKEILTVMGIAAALFILIGCATDPMSSTVTGPESNTYSSEPFYTTESEPCDRDNVCHGYETTTTTYVEKFEQDDGNVAVPPVYPE